MKKFLILGFSILSLQVFSQELPRRALLGVQMQPVTEEVQKVMNLPSVKGVLIDRVIPGSTAEAAGFKKGDILLKLGDVETNSPNAAVEVMKKYRAGQELNYEIFSNGKIIAKKVKVQGVPSEKFNGLIVEYGMVKAGNAQLRTLITKNNTKGKRPAILWIQGIGCYSMDTPMDTLRTEIQLINYLARKGFAVMRVEKSGIGDSKGEPCDKIDFYTELEGYTQGIKALQQRADIDADNVFIIGHSMGGVMAPLVAKELNVKGIIAYGTIGVNFMEYYTNSRRTIAQAYGMSPAEEDEYIKFQCECAGMILGAGMTREELVKRNNECGEVYDALMLRSNGFWSQLYDMNIPSNWSNYKGKVLAAWGQTDFISTRQEHEYIAETVNKNHKGNGTFVMVPNSSHGFENAASFAEARNKNPYNPAAQEIFYNWLTAQLKEKNEAAPWGTKEKVTEVLKTEGVENAYPRWSANQDKILFQSNRSGKWHLYVMNNDGTNEKQLTSGDHNNNFPDWTPDNSKIAFVSDRDGNEEIYVMNADGSGLKRLTENKSRDIHPYFAPDGKSLLFNSSRDNEQSFEVYQVNVDGTSVKRITNTPNTETCARFSPDMKKIVVLKNMDGINDEVCVMNTDGTEVKNLSNSEAREGWPAWSADGKKIIFASERNGSYRLFEVNADGTQLEQLSFANDGLWDARPSYSTKGDKVLFNRQQRNTIGIYILEKPNNM